MDFELSEEQRAFRDVAKNFAREEMAPQARAWDEGSIFPVEALRKAAETRILVKDGPYGTAIQNHRLDEAG